MNRHLRILSLATVCSLIVLLPASRAIPSPVAQGTLLTVLDQKGEKRSRYDFGIARAGETISHLFVLRNDTSKEVIIQRIQASCGCLTLLLGSGGKAGMPHLAPGATTLLKVSLETSRLGDMLVSPQLHKQVQVFVTGQPVPAAVLDIEGRLSNGVVFDPNEVEFGSVDESRGAERVVQVIYEAGRYVPGKTRLAAPQGADVRVLPMESDAEGSGAVESRIVRRYRVLLPPHTPIGLVSGRLIVEALTPDTSKRSHTHDLPPGILYTGQVHGGVSARPSLVFFGMIYATSPRKTPHEKPPAPPTTLWVLLTCPTAATAGNGPKQPEAGQGDPAASFWQQAAVQVDAPYFQAALSLPVASPAAASTDSKTPPPLPADLRPGTGCWLRVTLLPSAPHGEVLTGNALVTLPDGERIRLPIMGQKE